MTAQQPLSPLWRAALGVVVAGLVLLGADLIARLVVPDRLQPEPLDRFALADVGAGAYVHRRDATAGAWLEVDHDRVRTRKTRRAEGISAVDVTRKPAPGVVRVVLLGGSTTRGVPFDHSGGGFVSKLAPPTGGSWEVINLGVPGMDARGVASMMREARALHPHLYVIYTGNNEVVADLLDHCVQSGRLWVSATLDHLLLYRMLREGLLGPPKAAGSADALAAQDQCMAARVGEAWETGRARTGRPLDRTHAPGVRVPAARRDVAMATVDARFEDALDDVALLAKNQGVDVLLVKPAVNLRHRPERALGAPGSGPAQAAEVDAWMGRARTEGLPAWTEALRVDAHRADALYGWGVARLEVGGPPRPAVKALRAAIDHDYHSRRPTTSILKAMDDACVRWPHLTCTDASVELSRQARSEVLPLAWFHDHCHPSEKGNVRIARLVSVAIERVLRSRP